jgi:hypothetical protein
VYVYQLERGGRDWSICPLPLATPCMTKAGLREQERVNPRIQFVSLPDPVANSNRCAQRGKTSDAGTNNVTPDESLVTQSCRSIGPSSQWGNGQIRLAYITRDASNKHKVHLHVPSCVLGPRLLAADTLPQVVPTWRRRWPWTTASARLRPAAAPACYRSSARPLRSVDTQ